MSSLRGQGYDEAANMKGEFNGLQRLIQNENSTAIYVHCFAHQLQLTLVVVAKDNKLIAAFFDSVSMVLNVVGGFCKRHDMLQNIQAAKVVDALNSGELESERGLNQKTSFKRPGDTCWGSHFDTLINLIHMFSSMVGVLEIISDDNMSEHKGSATNLLCVLGDFDFAFKMHLMRDILGITNELSKLL
ncbi:zinc finger MYM-type protein 1-like protein [Cinnamomum micranthum f. kanehirae]|uniref:Zinc finger MYM-type protein 1-like protein n=1 Tax=Cinnamomum micranthum f. kanehirae TaxID=337451 RepID=A0A443N2E7_9MAGN|nr:zinc finger MYM-type protein 1-like protein [Cinnamomum micranthum f. kanehirae]